MSIERPIRCLQLSKFYFPVLGGIESVLFELTEGLLRQGFDIDVLCANTSRGTLRERRPYPVVRVSSLGKLLSTSISPAMVLELLRRRTHQEILHVHLPDPMANLAIYFARPSCKLIVHWHSDVVNQKRSMRLYAPLQNWLLKRADAIVATSEQYALSSPWLRSFLDKVHIVPIGISPAPFDPALVAATKQRYPGKRIVFSLGRMVYYKGFDTLIHAARALPSDAIVLVGGGGELLEQYRAEVRAQGLEKRIQFLGRLEDTEVSALMYACDVFCLPSKVRAEAFGVVLLEAMAAGRPIVATCIEGSGVPWVTPHGVTGLNVPVCDPVELARALTTILDDPAAATRYGAAARKRFEDMFTAERMVNATAALYRQLVAK
jgi:glycosyltransferase involved in cell wall biosynthesis